MVVSRLPFATHWQLLKRNYTRGASFVCFVRVGHTGGVLQLLSMVALPSHDKRLAEYLCSDLFNVDVQVRHAKVHQAL